jgi:hypothetical protein
MLSKKENDIVIFILILILIITLFVISTKLKEETNKNPSIKRHIIEKKMNEGFENECPNNNNISSQIDRDGDTLTLTILNDCISSDLIKKNNILKITVNTDQFTYFKIDDIDYNDNPNVVILKQNNLYTNINDIHNKLQNKNVTNVELMGTSDNCILTNKYKFSKVTDNLNIKYKLSIYDDFTDVTKTEFIKMVKNIFNYEDLIEIYLELKPSKSYLIENIDTDTDGTIYLNNINITSDTNSVNSTSDNKNILLIRKDINKQLKTKIIDDSKSEYITYLVNNLEIENIKNQINKLKDNNL